MCKHQNVPTAGKRNIYIYIYIYKKSNFSCFRMTWRWLSVLKAPPWIIFRQRWETSQRRQLAQIESREGVRQEALKNHRRRASRRRWIGCLFVNRGSHSVEAAMGAVWPPTGNHFLILKRAERGVQGFSFHARCVCGSPQTAFREQLAALLRLSLLAAKNLTMTMKGSTISQCFVGVFFFPDGRVELNHQIELWINGSNFDIQDENFSPVVTAWPLNDSWGDSFFLFAVVCGICVIYDESTVLSEISYRCNIVKTMDFQTKTLRTGEEYNSELKHTDPSGTTRHAQ